MYYFERAAETYIKALWTGRPLRMLSDEIAEKTAAEMDDYPGQADRHLAELKAILDEQEPVLPALSRSRPAVDAAWQTFPSGDRPVSRRQRHRHHGRGDGEGDPACPAAIASGCADATSGAASENTAPISRGARDQAEVARQVEHSGNHATLIRAQRRPSRRCCWPPGRARSWRVSTTSGTT